MKRRKFLTTLGVLPPLIFSSCGKDPLPTTPTTITGSMVDENEKPIEGWEFEFGGVKKIGISGVGTFTERTKTDVNGLYSFSVIVPADTDSVSFGPNGFSSDDVSNIKKYTGCSLFIQKNGKYELRVQDESRPIIGKSNTYNYQLKKK